jgi:two-component system sensor histidine kinase AgrC
LLILSITFVIIANNLGSNKITKGKLIYIIANTMITFFIVRTGNDFLLLPVSTIILVCISYINFKRVSQAIFNSILVDFVFAVSDAVAGLLVVIVFRLNFNEVSKNSLEYFLIAIVISIVSITLSKLLSKGINKLNVDNHDILKKSKSNLVIILYAGFVFIAIFVNIFAFKYFAKDFNNIVVALNASIILSNFVVLIIIVYLNRKNIKNELQQVYRDKEFRQLKEYTEMVETMSDDLRRFKHDYINILQTLGGYIEAEDMNGLKSFYQSELLPESEKIISKHRSLHLLKNIEINSLKGLISSKIVGAHLKNIATHVEITDFITDIAISEIDICRIIGILLDNAIESAVLCEEKVIRFAAIKTEKYTSFIISNTCPKDTPPVYKILEKGFSTKGSGRGIGLNTVRNIINEKYTNVFLNTKIKDCIFIQELRINNLKN